MKPRRLCTFMVAFEFHSEIPERIKSSSQSLLSPLFLPPLELLLYCQTICTAPSNATRRRTTLSAAPPLLQLLLLLLNNNTFMAETTC